MKKVKAIQRVEFIKKACAGKKVLHLGCTNYPYTEDSIAQNMLLHFELEKVCSELYGFDFDRKGIDILEGKGVKNLYQADLENLDKVELNEKFDVIIAGEMIEHLSNPGLFLRGIQRFMNKETALVITTINAYCGFRFVVYALRSRGGEREPVHPDHISYYSYKTLSLVINRENLDVGEFYFYDVGDEHRPYLHWWYAIVNDMCMKIFPHLSDGIIAVCRLK